MDVDGGVFVGAAGEVTLVDGGFGVVVFVGFDFLLDFVEDVWHFVWSMDGVVCLE